MKPKTRLILLLSLIVLFLIITPYLVLYSLGYRIDIKNAKIVATGGIYTRVQPNSVQITIDKSIKNTTGIFSNSIFVQNLLPGNHSVLIKKEGYYDYQKSLQVQEKEVTKLENVTLFSKNIQFEALANTTQFALLNKKPVERFIIVSSNLYYFDNAPENAQLTIVQKNTPIVKNILAFKDSGNSITWLGTDGFLKKSNSDGSNTENINKSQLKVSSKTIYTIEIFSQNIFLKAGSKLLIFNDSSKSFEDFYGLVKDIKVSPDGQKVIYYNDNEIFIYHLQKLPAGETNNALLEKSSTKISDVYWLNNDYIIFSEGNQVVISEIDYRGNINKITLPEKIPLINETYIDSKNPDIFFDQQNKKLYILIDNNLLSSDKILP